MNGGEDRTAWRLGVVAAREGASAEPADGGRLSRAEVAQRPRRVRPERRRTVSGRRGTRDPALPALPVGTHVIGCAYVRCVGFAEGNTLSVRHGAYATLRGTVVLRSADLHLSGVLHNRCHPRAKPSRAATAVRFAANP